ncbi:MAG: hypothetical protein ACM30E_11670 [Nitrososphaerales archaeon]
MKRLSEAAGWGIFLLLAGVFLLLTNLNVFGTWGELAWAALYALAGLGFLIWFFAGTEHWWRAIPAFTLLGIGATMLLAWRNIELGGWGPSLILFGMALSFWAILIVRKEHWWALVPAGVLTTVAVLFGLWPRLDAGGRTAVLLIGIGLMFLLLYVMRYDEHDARWAAVPAGALLLLGVVTLVAALPLPSVVRDWWPIVLVVAGALLVILGLTRRQAEPVAALPAAPAGFETLPPAPGAGVTTNLPPADPIEARKQALGLSKPPVANPAPASPSGGQVDIYDLIKQQPPQEKPPSEP